MLQTLSYLREFNFASVIFRLFLAMFVGGMIGLERASKHRPAGFRTYMLVCLGASLTILISQYETALLTTVWADTAAEIGIKTDVSRFGAQVINGIGFLGAGTIVITGRQKVTGLTTAAGLWASACMGLAVGAGFYECVAFAFVLIFVSIYFLPVVDHYIRNKAKYLNVYVEFTSLNNLGQIISRIQSLNMAIIDIELERGSSRARRNPNAIFSIRMEQKGATHMQLLSALGALEGIRTVQEI